MSGLFCIPLTIIALWESTIESGHIKNRLVASWILPAAAEDDDAEDIKNPTLEAQDYVYEDAGEGANGQGSSELQISKVPFEKLIKAFPNPEMVRTKCLS